VEAGMNMDVLGIKDPIASLQATKKAKKNPSDWTKQEILADNKMVVIFQPATQTDAWSLHMQDTMENRKTLAG
jgi:ABC-type molybdate transport system substrate-binding protein